MRALLQRVSRGAVTVDDTITGETTGGLVILLCAMAGDSQKEADYLAQKIARMRIFPDAPDSSDASDAPDAGQKINLSIQDTGGSALIISQFTLAADWRKGNRPGFSAAAPPDQANALYTYFCDQLRQHGVHVETGVFAAKMSVDICNEGPFTIWMDTEDR